MWECHQDLGVPIGWGCLTQFHKPGKTFDSHEPLNLSFYDHIHLSLASGTMPQTALYYQVYGSSLGTFIGFTMSWNMKFVVNVKLETTGSHIWYDLHITSLACEVVQGNMYVSVFRFFVYLIVSNQILNQVDKYHVYWKVVQLESIWGNGSLMGGDQKGNHFQDTLSRVLSGP